MADVRTRANITNSPPAVPAAGLGRYTARMTAVHSALACAPALLLGVAAALAQVPVSQEPRHRVVHEDARLRVLDVNVRSGDTTLSHRHDRDILTVSISAAETRTQSPGEAWGPVRPRRAAGDVGITEYTGKPAAHRIENVGRTLYRLIAVENVRDGGWTAGGTGAAPAGQAPTIESRAFRAYDIRVRPGAAIPPHTHAAPTVVIVAEGEMEGRGAGGWFLVAAGEAHRLEGEARVVEVEAR